VLSVSKTLSPNHADAISQFELIPIGKLKPSPNNARTHSKRQIKNLARLIDRIGFINPVITDENYQILAGHGRLAAARLLNMKTVPVRRVENWTSAEKRAYLIADNRIAEQAGWNRELLAVELGELVELLPAEDFDISLTGFEVAQIDSLFAEMAPKRSDAEDILPESPSHPTTLRGDLWHLGKHRILCGDARNAPDFTRLMGQESAF
jgi:ParB-like chromosome segregation protein Spo0J